MRRRAFIATIAGAAGYVVSKPRPGGGCEPTSLEALHCRELRPPSPPLLGRFAGESLAAAVLPIAQLAQRWALASNMASRQI
jgi:hypothetical protein